MAAAAHITGRTTSIDIIISIVVATGILFGNIGLLRWPNELKLSDTISLVALELELLSDSELPVKV